MRPPAVPHCVDGSGKPLAAEFMNGALPLAVNLRKAATHATVHAAAMDWPLCPEGALQAETCFTGPL